MIIKASFNYKGKHFDYMRPVVELDRNYEDEEFAYFLERIPNSEFGLFEINIMKEHSNGNLKENGYVSVYLDEANVMPDNIVASMISFWYI
jgi:hypothetical protein